MSADIRKRPIFAAPGDTIRYGAFERDLFVDDPLGAGVLSVQSHHRDGRAVDGRLVLQGKCEKF